MSDILKALRRPFHRWHDPDRAVYILGVPGYSVNATLKVCDICGKIEIIDPPRYVTPTVLKNLMRMRDV